RSGVLRSLPASRSWLCEALRASITRSLTCRRSAYTLDRATRHTAQIIATGNRRPVTRLRSPATSSTAPTRPRSPFFRGASRRVPTSSRALPPWPAPAAPPDPPDPPLVASVRLGRSPKTLAASPPAHAPPLGSRGSPPPP